ncbi:hypothetical protein RUM44_008821 [Polyplax serrata]|uniref:Uncharacterized protein n=1 Tax=Polyplax serrata TaxID=468196 RepID=A0ABR1BDC5_POLSC
MTISLQPKEEHEKKDKAKKYKNTRSKLKTLFIVPIWGIDEEYKRKNEDKNEKRGDSSQGVRKGKGKAKKVSFKLSRREGVHRLHKSSIYRYLTFCQGLASLTSGNQLLVPSPIPRETQEHPPREDIHRIY